MMSQRGECIREFALVRSGIIYAIGREQWQLQSFRNVDRNPISIFFRTLKMTLQFDVNICSTKYFR